MSKENELARKILNHAIRTQMVTLALLGEIAELPAENREDRAIFSGLSQLHIIHKNAEKLQFLVMHHALYLRDGEQDQLLSTELVDDLLKEDTA